MPFLRCHGNLDNSRILFVEIFYLSVDSRLLRDKLIFMLGCYRDVAKYYYLLFRMICDFQAKKSKRFSSVAYAIFMTF
jgi:hypothetical protein